MSIIEENHRLESIDKNYIWHPFTQMKDWREERPVIITEGKDCFIKDIYGKWYIDGVSSLWVNIHGHRRKEINDAMKTQLDRLSHSTLLGLSNVPAIELAEKIVSLISDSLSSSWARLNKIFYSDNGSTAVEIALKMAFQYWKQRGTDKRNAFLSLNNAYHGDTVGAVSVGGVDIFHEVYGPLLFKTYKAPSPYCYRCELGLNRKECTMNCLEEMEKILKAHAQELAAVIVEPLIQAAGGMIVAPGGYLKGVSDLCSRYEVLLIVDEVATGFGRTGTMFACENEGVVPDIICLSKGITGGYLPLAVTVSREEIFDAFLGDYRDLKTLFHGHSYTGNPLACAAALACLEIFQKDKTIHHLQPKIRLLEDWLHQILEHPHVGNTRNAGLMAGVELVKDKISKEPFPWEEKTGWQVALNARGKGVFIRPLGNVLVIMPPLSISIENLRTMLGIIEASIVDVTEKR